MCDVVSQIARHSQRCWNICLHIKLEHNHRHLMVSIKSDLISSKLVTSLLKMPTWSSTGVLSPVHTKTRFIVPVEFAGADRVLIVPEDSGSHRLREDQGSATLKFRILLWLKTSVLSDFLDECLFYSISAMVIQHWFRYYLAKKMQQANMSIHDASVFHRRCVNRPQWVQNYIMLYSFRLVGMREIHRWPVDDPHKGLVMHTIDVFFVGYTEKLLSKR